MLELFKKLGFSAKKSKVLAEKYFNIDLLLESINKKIEIFNESQLKIINDFYDNINAGSVESIKEIVSGVVKEDEQSKQSDVIVVVEEEDKLEVSGKNDKSDFYNESTFSVMDLNYENKEELNSKKTREDYISDSEENKLNNQDLSKNLISYFNSSSMKLIISHVDGRVSAVLPKSYVLLSSEDCKKGDIYSLIHSFILVK